MRETDIVDEVKRKGKNIGISISVLGNGIYAVSPSGANLEDLNGLADILLTEKEARKLVSMITEVL